MLAFRKLLPKPSLFRITSRFLSTSKNPKPNPDPDEPSSDNYDRLINIAGRSRDFATVHNLLNERHEDGCFNTTRTFKFITNTETETETDLSLLLDELSQTLTRLNPGFTRKGAFDSLIARLCKLNRIDESLSLIDTMIREKCGANSITFHPILNALTRKRRIEEAWQVMDLMRENEVSPDLTSYNFILTSYCVVGDLTSAAGVLLKIEMEEGMEANARTYDALVLGACKVGKVEAAMAVLRRMEDDGVPLLYCTHAHVMNALLELGYYVQAVEFVMGYGGKDKGLDTESFGVLASRLINLQRFEETKLLLNEMKNMDLFMGQKLSDFYSVYCKN